MRREKGEVLPEGQFCTEISGERSSTNQIYTLFLKLPGCIKRFSAWSLSKLPKSTLAMAQLRWESDHNARLCPAAGTPRGRLLLCARQRLTAGDSSREKATPGLE